MTVLFVLSLVSTPAIIGIVLGSVVFVLGAILTVCIYAGKRRSFKRTEKSNLKQFLLPKDVKPVMSFKTAAGPGGLKKSPSPIQSPENPESGEWARRVTGSGKNVQSSEPLLPKVDIEMEDTSEMQCKQAELDENKTEKPPVSLMGSLSFNLRYNFEKNALMVTIMGASGLPPRRKKENGKPTSLLIEDQNVHSLLDPYIKLQLLPEKQHKVKTRVVRNTLNPVYDEEFTFYGINYNQLQSTTLHFAVVSFDRYSRDEIIGEVICPLHSVDLTDSERQIPMTIELTNRTSKVQPDCLSLF